MITNFTGYGNNHFPISKIQVVRNGLISVGFPTDTPEIRRREKEVANLKLGERNAISHKVCRKCFKNFVYSTFTDH
jgi:hypothetical protein